MLLKDSSQWTSLVSNWSAQMVNAVIRRWMQKAKLNMRIEKWCGRDDVIVVAIARARQNVWHTKIVGRNIKFGGVLSHFRPKYVDRVGIGSQKETKNTAGHKQFLDKHF